MAQKIIKASKLPKTTSEVIVNDSQLVEYTSTEPALLTLTVDAPEQALPARKRITIPL